MKEKIKDLVDKIKEEFKSKKFDPNGSYTGNTEDKAQPVQDQDDL